MIDEKFRDSLDDYCLERDFSTILFENPAFDKSIVGITDDGRLVYDYEKMIDELAEDDEISHEEAQEFIDYNTMRALPYIGPQENRQYVPIILECTKEMIEELY